MKKIAALSVALFALLFFASASQNRKVLLIGIDGCRSDAFQLANTPNIDGLLGNATYTYDSWHTGITWSGPSWSTILTGVNWNKHGVTDNGFAVTHFDQYKPLPTLARSINPQLKSVIVAEWDPLISAFPDTTWSHTVKTPDMNTEVTADSAVVALQDSDLDLLFVYFDQVDMTGHTTTFSPTNPLYISAIENVDTAVGQVLAALYARPTYAAEDWLIMVVTDHGGESFFHGQNSDAERHIWWIASGNAVAHEQISKADPGTYNCNLNSVFDSACVDFNLMRQSPVHTDVTVTALHHLIYDSGINPETKTEWHLDGRSWLIRPAGIRNNKAEDAIGVYPNPTKGSFTITCPTTTHARSITVFDLMGSTVSVTPVYEANNVTIDLRGQPAGEYFVKVKTATSEQVKKIMVLP